LNRLMNVRTMSPTRACLENKGSEVMFRALAGL